MHRACKIGKGKRWKRQHYCNFCKIKIYKNGEKMILSMEENRKL